eukprot:COSAG02_NODE_31252_length_536_cov_1.935433_1_plen_127_part_00
MGAVGKLWTIKHYTTSFDLAVLFVLMLLLRHFLIYPTSGLRVVRRFLDGAPDNADAHRILGHLLAATGDTVAAEDAWRTAVKYKPDDSESYQALALSLFGATTYDIGVACSFISQCCTLCAHATAY